MNARSEMVNFHVQSGKIYIGQKNLHWRRQPRQRQLSGMPTSPTKERATQNRVLVFPKNTDAATWDRAQSGWCRPRTSVMLSSNPPSLNTWGDYKAIFYLGSRLQGNLLSGIEPLNCWLPPRQTLGHRFSCSPRAFPAPEHNFKIHLESPICSGRGSLPMAANPLSLFCQFWKALLTAVELLNLYKKVQAPKTSFTCSVSSPLHSALLNLWVCTKIKLFLRKCQDKRITANCLYSYQQSGYSSEQVSSSTNFVSEIDCWRESRNSSVLIALGVLESPELNHLLDPLWRG